MRFLVVVMTVVVGIATAAGVMALRAIGSSVGHTGASQTAMVVPVPSQSPPGGQSGAPACKRSKVGIATDNLNLFEKDTQIYPSVAVRYVNWGAAFPASTVLGNHGIGVETQLVLEPRWPIKMKDIADGREDKYLARWAAADKRLNVPIIFSFAPEANGSWYAWGEGHVSPALYKRAWRHVHNVLLRDGVRKITWMWQVNVIFEGSEPLSQMWPGPAYVDQVGLDGQMRTFGDSFEFVFGATIRQVRTITKRPVVIGEVSVHRGKYRVRQIHQLFAGLCQYRIPRFVFFDVKHSDINFELEGDPAALKAFKNLSSS
jgi:hypothetical protein